VNLLKRTIPVYLTALIGIVTILSFFVPHPIIADPAHYLQDWAIVVVASGYLLGGVNVLTVNGAGLLKRQADWPYKIVLLVSMAAMIVIGFFL